MRIYLAGPMRGIPDNNGPAFHAAAAALRALGHEVWSPAEHDEALAVNAASLDIRRTFIRDLVQVLESDAVVLLPGWPTSAGACLERHAAEVCGVRVYLFLEAVGSFPAYLDPLAPREWRVGGPSRPVSRR